MGTKIIIP